MGRGIHGRSPVDAQTHISNLRHVLDGRVIHERGGSRLDIDTAAIDAVRFGATLEKARVEIATDAAGAAAALKGALVSAAPDGFVRVWDTVTP